MFTTEYKQLKMDPLKAKSINTRSQKNNYFWYFQKTICVPVHFQDLQNNDYITEKDIISNPQLFQVLSVTEL